MDKSQIITLLVNAVVTIVTSAIVVRLSLNQGSLGVASKLKAKVTPRFKLYTKMILNLSVSIGLGLYLYFLVSNPASPTRLDVLLITVIAAGSYGYLLAASYFIGQILGFNQPEKRQTQSVPKNAESSEGQP